ncbi:hypothetical protein GCM10022257_01130 [Hyunsoonleella aestuarii]|uniref:Glycosyl transferase family 1 domain-containing protein n=2 Tax=Hyunsoonleella aestuarii TaxID=912802 RepID=A0ABP8E6Z6_9FLAO
MDVLFVRGGVLEKEFKEVSNSTYNYSKQVGTIDNGTIKRTNIFYRVINKIIRRQKRVRETQFYSKIASKNYDLIYANTIVSVPYGTAIKALAPNVKFLLHVHELQTIITTLLPDFKKHIPNIDKFIAVSNQVANNLTYKWRINEELIDVVYACAEVNIEPHKKESDDFIVGASGLSYWRKGNDVFIQVARYVTKLYPDHNIKFKWVGNEFLDKPIIESDIEKLGLQNIVEFTGELSSPNKAYNDFDVFLMTSREDPFPLVCIELAMLSKPIICFENASGSAEVIKKGGGFVVPYLDIESMSEKIVYYYKNRDKLKEHGENASALFASFTPENICPQLADVIHKTLSK